VDVCIARAHALVQTFLAMVRSAGATVVTAARSVPVDQEAPDVFVPADVSTAEGVAKLAREALDRLGGIDILVTQVD
jgi:NAD(P)-dependent dehydrogenase (short-subunit alcohol dehydrogenase family)